METKAKPEAIKFFEYWQVPLAETLVQFDFEHVPLVANVYVEAQPVHVTFDEQLLQLAGQAVQLVADEAYPGAH